MLGLVSPLVESPANTGLTSASNIKANLPILEVSAVGMDRHRGGVPHATALVGGRGVIV